MKRGRRCCDHINRWYLFLYIYCLYVLCCFSPQLQIILNTNHLKYPNCLVWQANKTFSNFWHILLWFVTVHNDADLTMNIKLIIYWLWCDSATCVVLFCEACGYISYSWHPSQPPSTNRRKYSINICWNKLYLQMTVYHLNCVFQKQKKVTPI